MGGLIIGYFAFLGLLEEVEGVMASGSCGTELTNSPGLGREACSLGGSYILCRVSKMVLMNCCGVGSGPLILGLSPWASLFRSSGS